MLTYVLLRIIIKIYKRGKGVQKIMPMKPRELIKLLEKNNFVQVSQNGSHVKMRNIENGKQVIVPFHNKELKKGTEQGILKQAGIK